MKHLVALLIALMPVSSYAATLLYSEGFESTGWESSFADGSWNNATPNIDRTTSAPYAGTYCVRGNLWMGTGAAYGTFIDPITGLLGDTNPQFELRGPSELIRDTNPEVFISFWVRYDDSTWAPSPAYKTAFLCEATESTAGGYFTFDYASKVLRITGINGGTYDSWYLPNWGNSKAYFTNPSMPLLGPDGDWHQIAVYWNETGSYLQFWIDGFLLYANPGSTYESNYPGTDKVYMAPGWNLRGLQLMKSDGNSYFASSTNGTGYFVGYQIDNIEVWDGIPPDFGGANPAPGTVTAPSNLTVTGGN